MTRNTDVLVIGAGPAGVGAALAAAGEGTRVIIVDENVAVGGHLRWSIATQRGTIGDLTDARGTAIAAWAVERLRHSDVEIELGAAAWGLFDDRVVGVTSRERSFQIRAGSVIVAAGATDAAIPFPGWDLPGVLTSGALLRLMHLHRVLPGRRFVVVGADPCGDEAVEALELAGADVVTRWRTCHDIIAGGDGEVVWLDVPGARHDTDCIVIAASRIPDPELILQMGGAAVYSAIDDCFVPVRSETLETSISGVYAAGDCAGVLGAAEAFAEGRVAGLAASNGAGLERALGELAELRASPPPHEARRPTLPAPRDSTLVCRCERIAAAEIRQSIADGAATIDDVKRRTRSGMGVCQGIYCLAAVSMLLQRERGLAPEVVSPMKVRPPARTVPLAALAGTGE
ncbi:MAG TPA: FAD-dependent oxidoreductase [Thermomicrobiales bacterium]|nr:FAD-dependent oxidoreductase [Thermomicrobiales bacterium]